MEELLRGVLGPFTYWIMALSLGAVVLVRRSVRKRHIVRLVLATVLGVVAFFAVFLWGLATWTGSGSAALFQATLWVLAAIIVACGSAVGFTFILMHLGFASLDER